MFALVLTIHKNVIADVLGTWDVGYHGQDLMVEDFGGGTDTETQSLVLERCVEKVVMYLHEGCRSN